MATNQASVARAAPQQPRATPRPQAHDATPLSTVVWLSSRAAPPTVRADDLPLEVVRAWSRLDAALTAYQNDVRREVGLTALQLYLLQLIGDRSVTLRTLRGQLSVHKATLGQAVKELVKLGLCRVVRSPDDARVRVVTTTPRARALVRSVPLAGPLLLFGREQSPATLRRLRRALETALELFGLQPWAPSAVRPRTPTRSAK
jgi:DNA-binding MarR family transcriptional regulator